MWQGATRSESSSCRCHAFAKNKENPGFSFFFFFFLFYFGTGAEGGQGRMVFLPADRAGPRPAFAGATLVVGDVSRGNVGQLAADLLITTVKMERVGYFDDPDVLPAVGMDRGKLCVNTELFGAPGESLFVLQQRSPTIPSREAAYGQRLAAWMRTCGFAKVVVLSSLPAEMRKDQLLGNGEQQISVGVCGAAGEARQRAEALGWRCIAFDADSHVSGETEWMHQTLVRREATPLSSALLLASREDGGEVVCVFAWAAEGDNLQDGIQMASRINEYLSILPPNEQGQVGWKLPDSWRAMLAQNAPRPVYT